MCVAGGECLRYGEKGDKAMMHKTARFLPFLFVAACALSTCSAHATTYYWIGGASGEIVNGRRALCVAPVVTPFRVVIR